jgi:hypothetical protein
LSAIKTAPQYRPGKKSASDIVGFGFEVDRRGLEPHEIAAALSIARPFVAPCPNDIALVAITKLRQRCKARAEAVDDQAAWIETFRNDLAEYPADIVVDVCRTWADENVFTPAWAELRAMCEWRFRKRRSMYQAIERAANE